MCIYGLKLSKCLGPIYKKSLIHIANAALKNLHTKYLTQNLELIQLFWPLIPPHTPLNVKFPFQPRGLQQPSPGPEFHSEFVESRSYLGQKILKQT
jgi:hypothetical protein